MNAPIAAVSETDTYVVIKRGSFYRPARRGYTDHIESAGIYTLDEAKAECEGTDGEVTYRSLSTYRARLETAATLVNDKLAAMGVLARQHSDLDLHRIEKRHTQDATWFNGGLHDPNGYVAMAHKDRGDLLARLHGRAEPDGDTVRIPKAAMAWLMGEGPDDYGDHFGDAPTQHKRPVFWWRTIFRRMCCTVKVAA